jgi:crossover junction endodeoxyribonuclease RusA
MTITVHGTPKPQGSKKFVGVAKSGRGILVESCKEVRNWREAVKWAAIDCMDRSKREYGGFGQEEAFAGPVTVEIDFYFVHPKSGKRRGTHSVKPDIDKLLRSTFDALKDAGVFEDDSRICDVTARKHYATQFSPVPAGAVIRVERWIA